MMYVQQKGLNSINWIMLEIKLPREINKSPLATEMMLSTLLQGGGVSDKMSKFFKGNLPIYSSLEIASLEGSVHFYIRIQKKFRSLVEANLYAQYPGIEIVEADDYTSQIHYHHLSKDVSIWGIGYRTSASWKPTDPSTGKPYPTSDPKKDYEMKADYLPIKTYVDYELDKNPKEEFKIDPLAPLLEIMGAMKKGEYLWYQILVQDESVYNGKKMPKFYVNTKTHDHISLKDMADARKKQIRTSGYIKHGDQVFDDWGYEKKRKVQTGVDADGKPVFEEIDLTYNIAADKDGERLVKATPKKETELIPEEKAELEAINKKLSKPIALCVMRAIYVSKKENFNPNRIQETLALAKPFTGFNSFAPSPTNPYSFPWENLGEKRSSWRGEEMFEAYVEREGFFPHIPPRESHDSWEHMFFWTSTMKQRKLFRMIYEAIFHPFDHPLAEEAFALNLEELATLWHLPGATVTTPTLQRIDSAKGVAPSNLPI